MGAREVLRSWAGWLMVSASRTTSCRERANSKILSISLCTSAKGTKTDIRHLHDSRYLQLNFTVSDYSSANIYSPKLERVLDLSMMALLLGLLRTDLLASDISAVTRVIVIL